MGLLPTLPYPPSSQNFSRRSRRKISVDISGSRNRFRGTKQTPLKPTKKMNIKPHHIIILLTILLLPSCATIKSSQYACPNFKTKNTNNNISFFKNKPKVKKQRSTANKYSQKPINKKNEKNVLEILSLTNIKANNNEIFKSLNSNSSKSTKTKKNFTKKNSSNRDKTNVLQNKKQQTKPKKQKTTKKKKKLVEEEYTLEKKVIYSSIAALLSIGLWISFILSPALWSIILIIPISLIGFSISVKARRNFKKDYKLLGKTLNSYLIAFLYISFQVAFILLVIHFQSLWFGT